MIYVILYAIFKTESMVVLLPEVSVLESAPISNQLK